MARRAFVHPRLFSISPKDTSFAPEALEAILNGPFANAFLTECASHQDFTNELLKQLPMPKREDLEGIAQAVRRYRAARVAEHKDTLEPREEANALLNRLLIQIDAEVLKAYDVPPRLERRLLEFFRGHEHERRVGHPFRGWLPEDLPHISGATNLGPLVIQNRGAWTLEVHPGPGRRGRDAQAVYPLNGHLPSRYERGVRLTTRIDRTIKLFVEQLLLWTRLHRNYFSNHDRRASLWAGTVSIYRASAHAH